MKNFFNEMFKPAVLIAVLSVFFLAGREWEKTVLKIEHRQEIKEKNDTIDSLKRLIVFNP